MAIYIYIFVAFIAGIILAWLAYASKVKNLQKELKSTQGLLESETLKKETSQKENKFLIQSSDAALIHTQELLKKSKETIRILDTDILLLQKSNEETEELLAKGEAAIPELKLKLIEAQNTISRLKGNNI
jgi:predicted Holliday junction resolvase-like endonuclease